MSSNSEIGHAKNVANFQDLIAFIIGYGITYNPTANNIKLANLLTQGNAAQAALNSTYPLETIHNNAIDARRIIFDKVRTYAARIINSLAGGGANQKTIDNASAINRKLNGRRAGGKQTLADAGLTKPEDQTNETNAAADPNTNTNNTNNQPPKQISVSQQSIDYTIEHFSKLLAIISAEPTYNPNEVDLKIAQVTAFLTGMKTSNTAVETAFTNLSNSRINRDKLLYDPTTGLAATAQQVKKYVKSVYGPVSPQYKQISGIKFKSRPK